MSENQQAIDMHLEGNSNAIETNQKVQDDNWGRERLDFLHFTCSQSKRGCKYAMITIYP